MPRQATFKGLEPHQIPGVEPEKIPGIFEPFHDNIRRTLEGDLVNVGELVNLRKRFGNFLLENFSANEFEAIQKYHLSGDYESKARNELKYLDTGWWGFLKLNTAYLNGLHKQQGLRILDIGTGPGHFQLAVNFLGHDSHGIDIPLRPPPKLEHHLYDQLCPFWRVSKSSFRINPYVALPPPAGSGRYDLVSAFMITFSVSDGRPWNANEWAFFLDDLIENQVGENSSFIGSFTPSGLTDPIWTIFKQSSAEYTEKNKTFRVPDLGLLKYNFDREV